MNEAQAPAFEARVATDRVKMRQAMEDQAPQGLVDFVVAVFGVPDSSVAAGESEVEIIDLGAFRSFAASGRTAAHLLDHGDAFLPGRSGLPRAEMRIGTSYEFAEIDEGLLVRARYNLVKRVAREAYSDLLDDGPVGWSFRWDVDGIRKERRSDRMHVVEFGGAGVLETSQLAAPWVGAQEAAHLVAVRATREEILAELPHDPELLRIVGERMVADPDFARDALAAAQKALAPSPEETLARDEVAFYERLFA